MNKNVKEGFLVERNLSENRKINPSLQLIEDLTQYFNISNQGQEKIIREKNESDLLHSLAFFCVRYYALFLELKTTPLYRWVNENLSDVYSESASHALKQTLEQYARLMDKGEEAKNGK